MPSRFGRSQAPGCTFYAAVAWLPPVRQKGWHLGGALSGPAIPKQNGAALLGPSTAPGRALFSRATWPDSGQGLSPATTHPVSLRLCTTNKTPPQGKCCLSGTGLQSSSHVSMDQQPRFTVRKTAQRRSGQEAAESVPSAQDPGTQFRNLPRPACLA